MKKVFITLVAAGALALAPAAAAHVTANPGEAVADSFAKFDLRVGHGCDGSPTTRLTVKIPDGVTSVAPQVVPGWQIATKTGKLAEPVEMHGETITEGVREVSWTGGPLADGHMAEFGLSVHVPDKAGAVLYFPTVQTCERGVHRWIQIPEQDQDPFELDEPAPFVTLVAAPSEQRLAAAEKALATASTTAKTASADAAKARDEAGERDPLALGLGLAGLIAGVAALGLTLAGRRR
jgi:periplasmic copper chaperone A